jgi:hypothetical protein
VEVFIASLRQSQIVRPAAATVIVMTATPIRASLRWDGGCRLKFMKNFIDQRSPEINEDIVLPEPEAVPSNQQG